MTRLAHSTEHVHVVTLVKEHLDADDAIAVRTTGGIYDTEDEYLLLGKFANQPREPVVSDNFPYAAIDLEGIWAIENGTAVPNTVFHEQCILHPHWSACVSVRFKDKTQSKQSLFAIGVISDFEAGDIATPRSLLTEEETIS
jgi:hypothetical protein